MVQNIVDDRHDDDGRSPCVQTFRQKSLKLLKTSYFYEKVYNFKYLETNLNTEND